MQGPVVVCADRQHRRHALPADRPRSPPLLDALGVAVPPLSAEDRELLRVVDQPPSQLAGRVRVERHARDRAPGGVSRDEAIRRLCRRRRPACRCAATGRRRSHRSPTRCRVPDRSLAEREIAGRSRRQHVRRRRQRRRHQQRDRGRSRRADGVDRRHLASELRVRVGRQQSAAGAGAIRARGARTISHDVAHRSQLDVADRSQVRVV